MKNQLLVVNSGSSSLKVTLFRIDRDCYTRVFDKKIEGSLSPILKEIPDTALCAVAHRIVHGGPQFIEPTLITPQNLEELEKLSELAPLHNPECLEKIQEVIHQYSWRVPQIALFDTAFHATIPHHAALYAIPYRFYKENHIKRYGFHGLSHAFLWQSYSKTHAFTHAITMAEAKIITVHLGSGCSIAAIKGGISQDTSMGFTPTEGLMMETRSGDLDPALIEYLCRIENKSVEEITQMINKESGILGISRISSDMKKVLENAHLPEAKLAIDMFCYRILKYIGAYLCILQGVDALIFSGGIGENSPEIRSQVIQGMQWHQFSLDEEKNHSARQLAPGEVRAIHSAHSAYEIYVIATDENLFMAQEAKEKIL